MQGLQACRAADIRSAGLQACRAASAGAEAPALRAPAPFHHWPLFRPGPVQARSARVPAPITPPPAAMISAQTAKELHPWATSLRWRRVGRSDPSLRSEYEPGQRVHRHVPCPTRAFRASPRRRDHRDPRRRYTGPTGPSTLLFRAAAGEAGTRYPGPRAPGCEPCLIVDVDDEWHARRAEGWHAAGAGASRRRFHGGLSSCTSRTGCTVEFPAA